MFAALQAGGSDLNALKREFLVRHGLTGRQFNAIHISLQGKIDSIVALRTERVAGSVPRIRWTCPLALNRGLRDGLTKSPPILSQKLPLIALCRRGLWLSRRQGKRLRVHRLDWAELKERTRLVGRFAR